MIGGGDGFGRERGGGVSVGVTDKPKKGRKKQQKKDSK
jgi:hypothetical protein